MNKKVKKIITTAVISAMSLTVIGCGTNNNKLAKNINKSMDDFVSSINKLDYVETTSAKAPTNNQIGKIVETSTSTTDNNMQIKTNGNHIQFLNNNISEAEIENTIKIPSERTDNFNLFVLSSTPYVSLSSDNNNSFNINVKFSTNQIEETSDEIENKINSLIIKRSILMIYVNEIYNGNVTLSNENKLAINAYVNVIKENTSYLNGNRGIVKNQLKLASDLASNETNDNLINYYIIKSGEALETRASKLDSTISAIDSIINIIESNLSTTSNYYQTKLSGTYNNLISKTSNITPIDQINETSSNEDIANKIACVLDFCNTKNETSSNEQVSTIQNRTTSNQQNLNNNSTKTISNENQTQNTLNNQNQFNQNNLRRVPNSIRNRRRNNNLNNSNIQHNINNQNQLNQNLSNIEMNNQNNLRNNNMLDNNKTMRATRTPEQVSREEYTTTNANDFESNRATRVPYKSNNINMQ